MKTILVAAILAAVLTMVPGTDFAGQLPEKNHDFLPKVHNLIFVIDVSDSMLGGYPKNFNVLRLFVTSRGLALFNNMMAPVPRWQYDLNTALITFGDCSTPRLLSPLEPWTRKKYERYYGCLRQEGFGPYRTATLQDALQLAGQLMGTAAGRTAIVIFSDGGTQAECPQKTVTALKDLYGDKVRIFAVFLGDREAGWRNLYEICKLSGGYVRRWEDVASKPQMQEFAWDITVREIMFPYPEIFFKAGNADL
ncbi:MAG: VWA domain-containing protein, partial [Deltaproteobacteria bacterium]|nr:VWA domain-containing protein [Deltaproteobacteria bacterium]